MSHFVSTGFFHRLKCFLAEISELSDVANQILVPIANSIGDPGFLYKLTVSEGSEYVTPSFCNIFIYTVNISSIPCNDLIINDFYFLK